MPSGGSYQAVILTAIPVEYEAVRAHLTDISEDKDRLRGIIYERGTFLATTGVWNVVIVEVGAGIINAALAAEYAINHFNPTLILFVGIAGGLKDVAIGDVVAAKKIYSYVSGKAEATFEVRPDVSISTFLMVQRARAEARRKDWLQRLMGPIPDPPPRASIAPIASGDQVVASTDSALYHFLRKNYSDALAVEMEGHGVLYAAQAYPRISALVIRGIADLINGKTESDTRNFQAIAARHASAFAFEVLAKLDADVLQLDGLISSGQQWVSQDTQYQTTRSEGKQVLPPIATAESLLQEFRAALPGYRSQVERIRAFFDETGYIYPHRYRNFMESLDSIGRHVQMLCRHASELNIYDSTRLFTIRDQIHALRLELQKFRPSFQLVESSRQRREDERSREAISAKCKALITNLERF